MPEMARKTCSQADCDAPLGEGFKFCAACGSPALAVTDFDLSPPPPRPVAQPSSAPTSKPLAASKPGSSRKGIRTALLVAGAGVGAIGLGLVGVGAFAKMRESGMLGGFTTSPETPLEAKADVWDGINARKAERDKAMIAKIEEAGGAP